MWEVRRLSSAWFLVILLALPSGGCRTASPGLEADGTIAPPDAGLCRCEYFGGKFLCAEGVVYRFSLAQEFMSCDFVECDMEPWRYASCEGACAYEGWQVYAPGHDRFGGYTDDATFLCAGAPNAQPGQGCVTDDDCLPQQAQITGDGTVVNTYLLCLLGECVATSGELVTIDRYLEPCGSVPPVEPDRLGFVTGTGCRFCLVRNDAGSGCLRQGCTDNCFGDHQCPPGSICASLPDLTPGATPRSVAVCKPGPPGDASALACP